MIHLYIFSTTLFTLLQTIILKHTSLTQHVPGLKHLYRPYSQVEAIVEKQKKDGFDIEAYLQEFVNRHVEDAKKWKQFWKKSEQKAEQNDPEGIEVFSNPVEPKKVNEYHNEKKVEGTVDENIEEKMEKMKEMLKKMEEMMEQKANEKDSVEKENTGQPKVLDPKRAAKRRQNKDN